MSKKRVKITNFTVLHGIPGYASLTLNPTYILKLYMILFIPHISISSNPSNRPVASTLCKLSSATASVHRHLVFPPLLSVHRHTADTSIHIVSRVHILRVGIQVQLWLLGKNNLTLDIKYNYKVFITFTLHLFHSYIYVVLFFSFHFVQFWRNIVFFLISHRSFVLHYVVAWLGC